MTVRNAVPAVLAAALLAGCTSTTGGTATAIPLVTYQITGTGQVSVDYLTANGSLRSERDIVLPWRRTLPLGPGGSYRLLIHSGATAEISELVTVNGAVVGQGESSGGGEGSFSGSVG